MNRILIAKIYLKLKLKCKTTEHSWTTQGYSRSLKVTQGQPYYCEYCLGSLNVLDCLRMSFRGLGERACHRHSRPRHTHRHSTTPTNPYVVRVWHNDFIFVYKLEFISFHELNSPMSEFRLMEWYSDTI